MKLHSMTGYAVASGECQGLQMQLELRSVNHRFLELGFRLPDEWRSVEMTLRERLNQTLLRGKVECKLGVGRVAQGRGGWSINAEQFQQVRAEWLRVSALWPELAAPTAGDVLRIPGVTEGETLSAEPDVVHAYIVSLLERALQDFNAARHREGQALAEVLLARVGDMERHVATLQPLLPALLKQHEARLVERLQDAVASLDPERIKTEVALFAQKMDVTEELDRLSTHLQEVRRVLQQGGAVGKRLDFLMQELNREANTLASKSVSGQSTQIALDLKVLIEQMREQIQNLE